MPLTTKSMVDFVPGQDEFVYEGIKEDKTLSIFHHLNLHDPSLACRHGRAAIKRVRLGVVHDWWRT